jgi:hypothetical protein
MGSYRPFAPLNPPTELTPTPGSNVYPSGTEWPDAEIPENSASQTMVDPARAGGRPGNPAVLDDGHLYGNAAGPRIQGNRVNVVGGVPYGEQLQREQATLKKRYLFRPRFYGSLRAATRSALGR